MLSSFHFLSFCCVLGNSLVAQPAAVHGFCLFLLQRTDVPLCSGMAGSLAWAGWVSYSNAVESDRTQPLFLPSEKDLARQREGGGDDPLAAARATSVVRSRTASETPLQQRLEQLAELDDSTLRARYASLRLAPRTNEFEIEKAEAKRLLDARGIS